MFVKNDDRVLEAKSYLNEFLKVIVREKKKLTRVCLPKKNSNPVTQKDFSKKYHGKTRMFLSLHSHTKKRMLIS